MTASNDNTVAVWSTTSKNKLDVMSGSTGCLMSAAVDAWYIATGSDDACDRVYENAGAFRPVHVFRGLHTNAVYSLSFVSANLLMSTSGDGTICFERMETDALPVARVNAVFQV